mgnify:CR=1 FL=1
MVTLTLGKKIKACRAILGMTRYDMGRACGSSEIALKMVEHDTDMTKAPVFEAYLNRNGLFLTDVGISTVAPTPVAQEAIDMDAILHGFGIDPDFASSWAVWDTDLRERFGMTVKAFAERKFDMWFVNMNGQIRVGHKSPTMQRGAPFAFIQVKPEGFYLRWHEDLDPCLTQFTRHDDFVERAEAETLGKHLDGCLDLIPQKIRELSSGLMPNDYT